MVTVSPFFLYTLTRVPSLYIFLFELLDFVLSFFGFFFSVLFILRSHHLFLLAVLVEKYPFDSS